MRVDAAAYLGAWPFRNVEGTVGGLLTMMQGLELDQAVVSPMPALFHTDPADANEQLLRSLKGRRNLWAAPVVNLRLADGKKSIDELARRPQVRAVRLAPGFHGYPAAQVREVLEVLAERDLAAVIQLRMQDERSHPVTTFIPPVPVEEVIALAESAPAARVVVAATRLGEIEAGERAGRIRALQNLWIDISHLDGVGCLGRAREAVGAARMLFATSWPFFYARSALLKVDEAELPADDIEMMMGGNAAKVFRLGAGRSRA
jgi:predicted TIM-barrel fold metal-dependent hydrolase